MSEEEIETLKQVRISNNTNLRLLEIIQNRTFKDNPVKSKQGIVQQAIEALYKKEVKK